MRWLLEKAVNQTFPWSIEKHGPRNQLHTSIVMSLPSKLLIGQIISGIWSTECELFFDWRCFNPVFRWNVPFASINPHRYAIGSINHTDAIKCAYNGYAIQITEYCSHSNVLCNSVMEIIDRYQLCVFFPSFVHNFGILSIH